MRWIRKLRLYNCETARDCKRDNGGWEGWKSAFVFCFVFFIDGCVFQIASSVIYHLEKMRGLWNNSIIHFNTHIEPKLSHSNSLLCLLCFSVYYMEALQKVPLQQKNISLLKSLYKPLLRKEPDVVRKSLLWNFKRSEWKNEKALPHTVFASLSCSVISVTEHTKIQPKQKHTFWKKIKYACGFHTNTLV